MKKNKVIVLLLIITMTFLLIACSQSKEPEKAKPETTTTSAEMASTATTTSTTTTTTKKTTTTTKKTEPEIESYPPGQYKVGTDIPVGLYYLISLENRGYFAVTSDANGDDILFNDNFGFLAYVELRYGEYIEVSRAHMLDAWKYRPILSDDLSELEDGMYMVGQDIPAGEYKLKSSEDRSAYYAIIDARHEIKTNNLFDGTTYVSVKIGDYLYLSSAKIISSP